MFSVCVHRKHTLRYCNVIVVEVVIVRHSEAVIGSCVWHDNQLAISLKKIIDFNVWDIANLHLYYETFD